MVGHVADYGECDFNMVGPGAHSWKVEDTSDEEGIRVYIKELLMKGSESEPLREWKRACWQTEKVKRLVRGGG
jgi:hypothetical protein